jgi:hypothetical protein
MKSAFRMASYGSFYLKWKIGVQTQPRAVKKMPSKTPTSDRQPGKLSEAPEGLKPLLGS